MNAVPRLPRGARLILVTTLSVLLDSSSGFAQDGNLDPDAARIVTTDIVNFWDAYDELATASTRGDSLDAVRQRYLAGGSNGLQAFFRLRIQRVENILSALAERPRYYAAIRQNTLALGRVEPHIRESLRRFHRLYPGARFPDVYFVMGILNTSGTLAPEGLLLAGEMLTADQATPTDELPAWMPPADTSANAISCLVVHELVHAQQRYPPGRFLLAQALREGVANFLARLTVGCPGSASSAYAYGDAHERELWEEFRQSMSGAYTEWLYNGHTSVDRPANLGYWMGDRIAQAFYDRANDKVQAVYDLLHITDYGVFLQSSGYGGEWER